MRHLPLLAALLPLVGGCVSSTPMDPPGGSVTVYWRFQSWDNQFAGNYTSANSGCLQAGVQEVDVDVYDARDVRVYFESHFCQASNGVPGVTVLLPPGSYSYVATAYRGRNHATQIDVFDTAGTFSVSSGFDTPVDATLDVLTPQPLLVLYSKAGAVTCAGVSGVTYSVSVGGGPVEADTVSCDPYNELLVFGADPYGLTVGTTYTVDFLQLLNGGFSINERCQVPVFHNGFAATIDLPASPDPLCGP